MQIKWFWIRDAVDNGELHVQSVSTDNQVAVIFTKALGKEKFTKFRSALGLVGDTASSGSLEEEGVAGLDKS